MMTREGGLTMCGGAPPQGVRTVRPVGMEERARTTSGRSGRGRCWRRSWRGRGRGRGGVGVRVLRHQSSSSPRLQLRLHRRCISSRRLRRHPRQHLRLPSRLQPRTHHLLLLLIDATPAPRPPHPPRAYPHAVCAT